VKKTFGLGLPGRVQNSNVNDREAQPTIAMEV